MIQKDDLSTCTGSISAFFAPCTSEDKLFPTISISSVGYQEIFLRQSNIFLSGLIKPTSHDNTS